MATLNLDDEELRSVQQLLSRVAQLSSSIQSLKMDLLRSDPLPPPSSIQASAQILQRNLQSVNEALAENADLLNHIAIHPSTNFPGRTQEAILTQLLRKKLEPDVEEMVNEGRDTARLATPEGIEQLQDIWHELREWTIGRIATYVREEAGDPYTQEEREMGIESLRTGLKRDLEDDPDDEGDENDDEDEGQKEEQQIRGPEPETLLWFAARGDFEVPRNVEFERKVDVWRGMQGVYMSSVPQSNSQEQMQGVVPS